MASAARGTVPAPGPIAARPIEVRDPESGALIDVVPRALRVDALQALDRAERAKDVARGMPVHARMDVLGQAADRVATAREAFARTIAREGVKTIREARLEVDRCVMTLRLCAEESRRLTGETIAFDQRPGSEDRFGYTLREPAGIVAAITPFNDPLNLVAHKVGPAIAAGNAVLLKPHERTPLSALSLASALREAGLPEGVLQVLVGSGEEVGLPLVEDRRVRVVSFTGGRATGERIARLAGPKRLALELGSNCPTLIMPDADLEAAARACVSGAYWAAGQNCLHVQRVYAHRDVIAPLRERMVALTAAYQLGPKLDEATDMGCLIDAAAAERVHGAVTSALAAGADLLTGGGYDGPRFAPTLLEGVPDGHVLARDEVFGPVAMLFPFTTLDEAITRANAVDYGLQAAIFTRDLGTAFDAVARLEAGTVLVNDATDYRLDAAPFGGLKGSGIGREGVRSAVLEMSEPKVACFRMMGPLPRPRVPLHSSVDLG